MAFITINGRSPADHGAAFVAENATLAGCVRLAKESSVWYGAVLRADTAASPSARTPMCRITPCCTQALGWMSRWARGVSIGHGAIVHGCTVGDHCLIRDARHDPERRGHRGRLPDRCRGTGAGGDGYPCGQPCHRGAGQGRAPGQCGAGRRNQSQRRRIFAAGGSAQKVRNL